MSGITSIMCTSAVTVLPVLLKIAYPVPRVCDGVYGAWLQSHLRKKELSGTNCAPLAALAPSAAALPVPNPGIAVMVVSMTVAAAAADKRVSRRIADHPLVLIHPICSQY